MAGEKKFFLGVGGQQTGPFTEAEVNGRIANGEAKADTLIWYEGLAEWQRLDSVAFFQEAIKKGKVAGAAKSSPAATKTLSSAMKAGMPELKPVFSSEEAVFFRRKGPRPEVLIAGGILLLVGIGAVWYIESGEEDMRAPISVSQKGAASRFSRLRKADSDYLLNPTVIPDELLKLITEDSKDEAGVKAIELLETIYKKRHRNRELADLYMKIHRPADALPFYLEEKAFPEAELAAVQAYEAATDPKTKYRFLVQAIGLMAGPAHDLAAALPRIRELEKQFPHEPNPYGYYLLSEERKMSDLFNRTSFFFVEHLITHMKAEFPQIKLVGRPEVKIVREGGKYRIAGSYKGEVVLSQDKLKNIRFEYWMVAGEWNLVSTNVTGERQEWAKNNRSRFLGAASDGPALLTYLEGVVRAQFPRSGLHEKISQEAMSSAARETASSASHP